MLKTLKSLFCQPIMVIGVLIVLTTLTMIRFDRPLIRGDGVAYLGWVDTLAGDFDAALDNQAEKLAPVNTYQIVWLESRQRYVTVFPFGVAFVQAPFYWMGKGFRDVWNANPEYFNQMQGVGQSYSLWLMIGANVMMLSTVILGWLVARRLTDDWTAALAAFGFAVGTPLLYYSTVEPLNSHNPGAFLAAAVVFLLMTATGAFSQDDDPAPDRWLVWVLLGISAGLMVMARWQLLWIAVPAWGVVAWQRRWKGLAIATAAAAVTLLPLPLIWNAMFGRPFVVPYNEVHGQSFIGLPVNAHLVLGRLLSHAPVVALSLIGIVFLWTINREWAVFSGVAIVLQILTNGAAADWWAGSSFGPRRMSELYPLYVLLAVAVAGRWQQQSTWDKARFVGVRVLLAAGAAYGIYLLYVFLLFTWTNQEGLFAAPPDVMLAYFRTFPNRQMILKAVLDAHVGPPSWMMPGP